MGRLHEPTPTNLALTKKSRTILGRRFSRGLGAFLRARKANGLPQGILDYKGRRDIEASTKTTSGKHQRAKSPHRDPNDSRGIDEPESPSMPLFGLTNLPPGVHPQMFLDMGHEQEVLARRTRIRDLAQQAISLNRGQVHKLFTVDNRYGRVFRLIPPITSYSQLPGCRFSVRLKHKRLRTGLDQITTLPSPPPSSTPAVVFQRYREGPWAISNELADTRCRDLTPAQLLGTLNGIHNTQWTLIQEGCEALLQTFIDQDFDFGEVYGALRPWWASTSFTEVLETMERRKVEDRNMRRAAIDGECIVNPKIPPRRVWDLYSNRVLPYSALNIPSPNHIPPNIWTVSHGWLEPSKRQSVMTPINDSLWPVPIPRQTTLEHVRIELLNLGAEYVFLDVLCLRQRGHAHRESLRKKEWRLDVPTIGYVFQATWSRPIIIYFNGLGIEFCSSTQVKASPTHWFNRVWTAQESGMNWIPGGLAANSPICNTSAYAVEFDNAIKRLVAMTKPTMGKLRMYNIVNIIRDRSYTNEMDRVASIAYLLRCETLPVYDETGDVEYVWDALVEHMTPQIRTDLLVTWPLSGNSDGGLYSWRPSWSQLMDTTGDLFTDESPEAAAYADDELLRFKFAGRLDGFDAYYHHAYFIPSAKVWRARGPGSWSVKIRIPQTSLNEPLQLDVSGYVDTDDGSNESYTQCLVGVQAGMSWVVGEVIGMTTVHRDKGPVVRKTGVIWMDASQGSSFLDKFVADRRKTFVSYL